MNKKRDFFLIFVLFTSHTFLFSSKIQKNSSSAHIQTFSNDGSHNQKNLLSITPIKFNQKYEIDVIYPFLEKLKSFFQFSKKNTLAVVNGNCLFKFQDSFPSSLKRNHFSKKKKNKLLNLPSLYSSEMYSYQNFYSDSLSIFDKIWKNSLNNSSSNFNINDYYSSLTLSVLKSS